MAVRAISALAVSVWLLASVGCDHLNDKNGNPYSQGPADVGCSWVENLFGSCPEFVGPPQKNAHGQVCQTFKRGSIYETRCE